MLYTCDQPHACLVCAHCGKDELSCDGFAYCGEEAVQDRLRAGTLRVPVKPGSDRTYLKYLQPHDAEWMRRAAR